MNQKPWPLISSSLLCLISPWLIILLAALSISTNPARLADALLTGIHPLGVVYYLLPLAMAPCIFWPRTWTFVVYHLLWIAQTAVLGLLYTKTNYPLLHGVLLASSGILALNGLYLWSPMVRTIFFNARSRWWESKLRFVLQAPGQINVDGVRTPCTLVDFAVGGAFIEVPATLTSATLFELEFQILNQDFKIPAKIVHHRGGAKNGYGIYFMPASNDQEKKIKRLTQELQKMDFMPTRKLLPLSERIKSWPKEL